MAEPRRSRRAGIECPAILWKRFDFRESSRIVVLLTREHGRVQALAKGAHRPDSPLLGRLDFLNELHVRLSPDRGGLRLLLAAELLRERRGLRTPARFLAASHLVGLCDFACVADHGDPGLFDLVAGGSSLLERCPPAAIAAVALGLELRLLAHLGALPDLDRCGDCGAPLQQGAFVAPGGALLCRRHAGADRRAVAAAALAQLRQLCEAPGRQWPRLPLGRLSPTAVALPETWLQTALDRRSRLRARVFRGATAAAAVGTAMDSGAGGQLP